MDDGCVPVSHSLPSSSPLAHRKKWRKTSLEQRQDAGHLVSNATTRNLSSPPPRALTQYVSIRAEQGDALEETSGPSHIFLPSTIGLRSSSHVSDFSPPPFFSSSSPESSLSRPPSCVAKVRRHHHILRMSYRSHHFHLIIIQFTPYPDVPDLQDHPHRLADQNRVLAPAPGQLVNPLQTHPRFYLVRCRPPSQNCPLNLIPPLRIVRNNFERSNSFEKF